MLFACRVTFCCKKPSAATAAACNSLNLNLICIVKSSVYSSEQCAFVEKRPPSEPYWTCQPERHPRRYSAAQCEAFVRRNFIPGWQGCIARQ